MSEQGLETIESTTQKTYEWIARIAERLHIEKRDAYKSLGAVLQTLRNRLPRDLAVHFGAQLPMLVRGLYYQGWEPSKVPVKMSCQEFLDTVQEKIVAGRVIDPAETVESVVSVVASYISAGKMAKLMHSFPHDMQS
jgi:uncharacterized protein (DUF2267 family)